MDWSLFLIRKVRAYQLGCEMQLSKDFRKGRMRKVKGGQMLLSDLMQSRLGKLVKKHYSGTTHKRWILSKQVYLRKHQNCVEILSKSTLHFFLANPLEAFLRFYFAQYVQIARIHEATQVVQLVAAYLGFFYCYANSFALLQANLNCVFEVVTPSLHNRARQASDDNRHLG